MSLRWRLLLAVGAVALLALLTADVATYSSLKSFLYERVDQSLESAHQPLEQSLNGDGHGGHPGPPDVVQFAPGTFVELRSSDDAISFENPARFRGGEQYTPNLADHIDLPTSTGGTDAHTYFTVGSVEEGGPEFRVRASTLPSGGQLLIAVPLDDASATLHRLLAIEVAVTAGALIAAAALGWWLVRVGLHPLAEVEATADAIADGDLDRRVPGDDAKTEVGHLALAFNTMLGRIQDAFTARDATEARLRRFVADASHELRTPVAAVSAYAELFERGANVRPDDLGRVMTGIRAETARMGDLVEDLLLLARLDEGRPLEQESVELVAVAAQAIDASRAVGPDWQMQLDAAQSVEVMGDAARLRQVFDNLLGNVRSHTPPGTATTVRLFADGADAVIEVADNGPGLNPEQSGRVFERFYRVEASRSREHGGAGLGLAIVAAIVTAHGGRVDVSSSVEQPGAVFTVRLPLTR
ncbi:MAG: two-component system, OmpR family, sensor kinase [Acidimicrobiaceae bacterium]|jgi:two-component system OmpR family sensor kinase